MSFTTMAVNVALASRGKPMKGYDRRVLATLSKGIKALFDIDSDRSDAGLAPLLSDDAVAAACSIESTIAKALSVK